VATGSWLFWTKMFVKVEEHTQLCHGSPGALRDTCHSLGGKWIPGFDISGHTFLLIYSSLVAVEEALVYRNFPTTPRPSLNHSPSQEEREQFRKDSRYIQWLFIGLSVMVAAWDIQLVITLLYYHAFWHKVLAVVIAVGAWYLSYKVWYVCAFPWSPIRRYVSAGTGSKKKK